MFAWVKANGGPLALVAFGLGLGGFTSRTAGLVLIGLGLAWFLFQGAFEMAKKKRQHVPPTKDAIRQGPPPGDIPGIPPGATVSVLIGGSGRVGRARIDGVRSNADVAAAITGSEVEDASIQNVEHRPEESLDDPQAKWEKDALALFQAKHDQAVVSAYRDIFNRGGILRDQLSRTLQGSRESDPTLHDRAGAWCNRCVLWASDAGLTGEERARFRGKPLEELSTADYFTRMEDNLDELGKTGKRLGL